MTFPRPGRLRWRLPGGIRARIALALLVVVGSALASAYIIVVPSLEQRLVDAKLSQLEEDAILAVGASPARAGAWQAFATKTASDLNARVSVIDIVQTRPLQLRNVADSNVIPAGGLLDNPVALEAARTGRVVRGRVSVDGTDRAEVAVLPRLGTVVLVSAELSDPLATVRLLKRRLLAATGVALAFALGLGMIAAAFHARRIRRLERAANQIAAGRFDDPVTLGGNDELAQLADAFDRMRRQLAQLDTARKEFVANASHELRTPLFSLAGFLELITDDEDIDSATRQAFLVTMREQVDRLTKLATDLLDLSRMDVGRIRIEREDVYISDVARTLGEEMHVLAEHTRHHLLLDITDDVWALADEERVLQIGRALASNAVVHTPAGTNIVVRVLGAGGIPRLIVEDDGPGIPAAYIEQIFDRFYRIEGGQASGSGLGLAIANELAQRMGGRVTVDSRAGRTVFTLTLQPVSQTAVDRVSVGV
jgi:two-component system OmpR family sensor kinase